MVRRSIEKSDKKSDIYEKLLHIKDIKSEDHLMLLLKLPEVLKNYKLVSVFIALTLFLCLLELSLFITELIRTFDSKLIIKYGSHTGVLIFMIICQSNVLVFEKSITDFVLSFQTKLIPIELSGEETQKKILHRIKLLKCLIYLGLLSAAVAAGLFVTDNRYNYNEVYFYTITSKMNWMNFGQALHAYYRLSYIIQASVAITNAYIISYIGFHSNYQLVVLEEFIDHMCDNTCSNEENLYYDETSQRIITERMKICIMIHQSIYSEVRTYVKIVYNASFLLLMGGLFIGGGVMIKLFRDTDVQFSSVGIFFISLAATLNCILYSLVGQSVKDESTNVRKKLLNLPWYNMNKKNKQILLIFLMRTDTPVCYDTDMIQVDYLLIVRIVRGLYSVATVLSRTMQSKNE